MIVEKNIVDKIYWVFNKYKATKILKFLGLYYIVSKTRLIGKNCALSTLVKTETSACYNFGIRIYALT